MLPGFFPGMCFCIFTFPRLLASDALLVIECILLVFLSRWPLRFASSKDALSYQDILKKTIFFLALQSSYGLGLHILAPNYFDPLIWTGYPAAFKYDLQKMHRSSTGIQLFYDDRETAERIELALPTVIATLKASPLFQGAENLIIVQKPSNALSDLMIENKIPSILGAQISTNQNTYYFTGRTPVPSCYHPTYYAHNDPDRAVITHELTHQMVAHYYGKWAGMLYIELWKNEGYAEYMVAKGYYSKNSELLAILEASDVSDDLLQNPFNTINKKTDMVTFNDYIGALMQTRYALDVKKIPVLEFFKRSYKPVSAQEIKDWLMKDDQDELIQKEFM